MNKSIVYEKVIEYAKANNINFAFVNDNEICPDSDLNGYCLLDTDTFEIPCTFAVDKAVILCIDTPTDMTPDDTGKSYDKYWNTICELNNIQKPQYVALDGSYVKLMCWCDWDGEEYEDFIDSCEEVFGYTEAKYGDGNIDLRLVLAADVEPIVISTDDLEKIWDCVKNLVDWKLEVYVKSTSESTGCGVVSYINSGIRIIKTF